MQRIDLVCRNEERHRAKLLREHMRTLGVAVEIHATTPDSPTPYVLFVLARGRAPDPDPTAPTERVAIHFDAHPVEFDAVYHAPLQAWPARSADAEVKKLIYQLNRLTRDRNRGQNADEPKPSLRSTDPANKAAIGFAVVLALAIYLLAQSDFGPTPIEQTTLPDEPTQFQSISETTPVPHDTVASTPNQAVSASASAPRDASAHPSPGTAESLERMPDPSASSSSAVLVGGNARGGSSAVQSLPQTDRSTIAHFCRAQSPAAKMAWYRLLGPDFSDHPCVRAYAGSTRT